MKLKSLYLVYLFAVTCMLLGLLEWALRLVDYTPAGRLIPSFCDNLQGDYDPLIKVRDRVNETLSYVASTDERGFRSNTAPIRLPHPNPIRILCLGDSYTFGYGVEDALTYPAQLESILSHAYPEVGFDVMNAGVPRYGLDDEISVFERKGEEIKPDLVILQFFLNDIQDMVRKPQFGSYLLEHFHVPRRTSLERLATKTELYRFARKVSIAKANINPTFTSEEQRKIFTQGGSLRDELTQEQRGLVSTYEGIVSDASVEVLAPLWQEYLEKVMRLRDLVERQGGKFLFMIVPDAHQITQYQLVASRCLVPFLQSQRVDVLDLTFPFMAQTFDRNASLYLASDPHCSPAGNGLVARRLADGLSVSGGKLLWLGNQLPLRDYASRKQAALTFDPRHNSLAVTSQDAVGVEVFEDNLAIQPDDGFGIALTAPKDPARPGTLDLRISAGAPMAFLDAVFHYRLPNPDSRMTILASEDGITFVPVEEKSSNRGGTRESLHTRYIARIPLTPRAGQRIYLRFILQNGANLVTDKLEAEKRQRPFDLFLYPPHPVAGAPLAVSLTTFPKPNPGDLLNLVTMDKSIAVQGLGGIERDQMGKWRWGMGPETEITFDLPAPGEVEFDLRFCNIIEGQQMAILANDEKLADLKNLPKQAWLRDTRTVLRFQGNAGRNTFTIRYGLWNRYGAEVSQTDATPYALAFTGLTLQGVPK